jgi:two-component system sensor histidine kinase AlgZ
MVIVVIAELLAIVLALAPGGTQIDRWHNLGLTSLFIQWVALTSTDLLCLLRPWLRGLNDGRVAALSFLLLLGVVVATSEVTLRIAESAGLTRLLPEYWHFEFLLRNAFVGAIVGGVTLRYFFVQHQWKKTVRAEMQARVQALQARIRPHFLFNSINTIACLIRTRPVIAEQAIEHLAQLFRASLTETRLIPLEAELDLTRRYLEIEQLRLDERLRVVWELDGVPQDALVPALTIQPLVENAIYHGIEPSPEGGTVRISGSFREGTIAIEIRNPVSQACTRRRGGHQMAQDSVRQRLAACYGKQGGLEVVHGMDQYLVRLNMPYETADRR